MFATASCEPTLPKPTHFKREPASIVNQQQKKLDTTTLINNTSTSTIDSPAASTRLSSTIMTGSIALTNIKENTVHNSNNAMTNSHEIVPIKKRVPIKSIRIERDYSLGDGITRFNTEYPAELTGKITKDQFEHTITEINKIMDYADRLTWKIILENIVETLTLYLWPVFFSTHYQRVVTRLLGFIESENDKVYSPMSLSISNPVKSAFLFLEINFYD